MRLILIIENRLDSHTISLKLLTQYYQYNITNMYEQVPNAFFFLFISLFSQYSRGEGERRLLGGAEAAKVRGASRISALKRLPAEYTPREARGAAVLRPVDRQSFRRNQRFQVSLRSRARARASAASSAVLNVPRYMRLS